MKGWIIQNSTCDASCDQARAETDVVVNNVTKLQLEAGRRAADELLLHITHRTKLSGPLAGAGIVMTHPTA